LSGGQEIVDLVFAGRGVKSILHAGAAQELERLGFRLERLVGTSAGSIVAMLLAAGT
jgi:NTE family protein